MLHPQLILILNLHKYTNKLGNMQLICSVINTSYNNREVNSIIYYNGYLIQGYSGIFKLVYTTFFKLLSAKQICNWHHFQFFIHY